MSATRAWYQLYQTHNYTPTVPLALSEQAHSPLILKQILVLQLPRPKSCHSWSVPTLLRATLPWPSLSGQHTSLPWRPSQQHWTLTEVQVSWKQVQGHWDAILGEFHPACQSPAASCSTGSSLPATDYQWAEVSRTLLTVSLWKTSVFQQIGTSNTNREGEPQDHHPYFALQPQVCCSCSTGCTRTILRCWTFPGIPSAVPDSPWCTGPLVRVLHVPKPDPSSLQRNAPAGHMYNAITL